MDLNPFSAPDTSALSSATDEDRKRAAEFYRNLSLLNQQYNQQLQGQGAQVRSLDATIAGTTPSVANAMLQRNVNDIANSARATASGATGAGAPLAQYGAIQAVGAAQAKAAQDAALIRAKEIEDAQALKAQIQNQQQQATGNMYQTNTGAGTALSGQTLTGATTQAKISEDEKAAYRNLVSNLAGGGASALVTAATR